MYRAPPLDHVRRLRLGAVNAATRDVDMSAQSSHARRGNSRNLRGGRPAVVRIPMYLRGSSGHVGCIRSEHTTSENVMGTIETGVDKAVSKLEGQLKLWSAKLSELAAKAEVAGQETKIEARKQLDEMKSKLKVAQSKLEEAKAAGGDKWDKFKVGLESSWKELEGAFQKLMH
jgi:hypothetical protein